MTKHEVDGVGLGVYVVAAPPHPDQRVTVTRVVRNDWHGHTGVYFTEADGRANCMGADEFKRRATRP